LVISRRAFLSLVSTWGLGTVLRIGGVVPVEDVAAQQQPPSRLRIVHLSRRQGPSAEMASYAIMGAQLGAEEATVTAEMFGTKVELIIEEAVTPENVESLAGKLSAQENLAAIIGALDDLTIAKLSDVTQQQPVVCLNTAARGGDLRGEKCHRLTFHIEPDLAMYTHAMGQWLVQTNRRRWHFVVSESAPGQEVYRRASRFLQQQGGIDLGRLVITPGQSADKDIVAPLAQSDAEAIVVALSGEDLERFLEHYKAAGLKPLLAGVPLNMFALWRADPALLQGVWVASWYHELERYSARELNRRFMRRFEKPAEGFAWANWAAVKLVAEGVLRSASTDAKALVSYLEGAPPFDGHKGKALTFREWNHQLRQPLYVLKARESKPENTSDLLELIGEMPTPAARGKSAVEVLDTLGEPRGESACRLETL
jgi:branched-chain amino acid transport system substrate-binding protein